jgi:hypothetical protein
MCLHLPPCDKLACGTAEPLHKPYKRMFLVWMPTCCSRQDILYASALREITCIATTRRNVNRLNAFRVDVPAHGMSGEDNRGLQDEYLLPENKHIVVCNAEGLLESGKFPR